MTTYNVKHADGTIEDIFRYLVSAKRFKYEYEKNCGETLIIEKISNKIKEEEFE